MRAQRRPERDEEGMTLIELIVAMAILVTVLIVFMAAVVVMTKDTARVQAVSDSGDAVRKVFQTMDRQVRYADAINSPGFGSGGAYYVEYRVIAPTPGDAATCYQWRYQPASLVLQSRQWKDDGDPDPSAWTTVAAHVRNGTTSTSTRPFKFTRATGRYVKQQLTVVLDVGPGAVGDKRAGAGLEATFVARNTNNRSTVTNLDTNADGISDTFVCQSGVGRP